MADRRNGSGQPRPRLPLLLLSSLPYLFVLLLLNPSFSTAARADLRLEGVTGEADQLPDLADLPHARNTIVAPPLYSYDIVNCIGAPFAYNIIHPPSSLQPPPTEAAAATTTTTEAAPPPPPQHRRRLLAVGETQAIGPDERAFLDLFSCGSELGPELLDLLTSRTSLSAEVVTEYLNEKCSAEVKPPPPASPPSSAPAETKKPSTTLTPTQASIVSQIACVGPPPNPQMLGYLHRRTGAPLDAIVAFIGECLVAQGKTYVPQDPHSTPKHPEKKTTPYPLPGVPTGGSTVHGTPFEPPTLEMPNPLPRFCPRSGPTNSVPLLLRRFARNVVPSDDALRSSGEGSGRERPLVSFVVPYYDDRELLLKHHVPLWFALSKSLAAQLEIVLVDAGSQSQPLAEVLLGSTAAALPPTLRLVAAEMLQRGSPDTAGARNLGALLSRGHFIAFLDIDVVPSVKQLSAFLGRTFKISKSFASSPSNKAPFLTITARSVISNTTRPAVATSRRAFAASGGFNEVVFGGRPGYDDVLFLQCALNSKSMTGATESVPLGTFEGTKTEDPSYVHPDPRNQAALELQLYLKRYCNQHTVLSQPSRLLVDSVVRFR